MRRNGQARPFMVAVSRRGALGGAVAGDALSNQSGLYAHNANEKVVRRILTLTFHCKEEELSWLVRSAFNAYR